ncbi:MAG: glycosyltransferase family 1 protein [Ktedonobacteraceae bacterium]
MKKKVIKTVAFDARYVSDRYHGIGRHAYNLLEALTRLDLERHYIIYYNPDYRNTRFNIEALGERPNVELRPIRLHLYFPGEQLVWPLLLARDRVDLFHSPYVLLPLLARTTLVMTMHDLIFELYPQYQTASLLQKFYFPMTRLGIQRAKRVLTVSDAASRNIQTFYHVNAVNIHVIGNAVDATFQPVTDLARLAVVRERYHLPEHFILSLGVGRPHKNIEMLVKAFACLDPALAISLVIVGEPDSRFPDEVGACIHVHNLASRVVRLSTIREADLPVVYSLANVFVFPSLVEGFGLPPLEAMACGVPVLASTTPAVAEVVNDAALLFAPQDSQALAALLSRVLTDDALRASLSQRGRERVLAFTWERVAHAALQAYASIETTNREALDTSKR